MNETNAFVCNLSCLCKILRETWKLVFPIGCECGITHSACTCRPCHVSRLTTTLTCRVDVFCRDNTGVSLQRWRSRSSCGSRPSASSVRPAHRGGCEKAWAPWRGWPPPPSPLPTGNGGLVWSNGKVRANTQSDASQVVKTNPVTSVSCDFTHGKCSDGKSLHQAPPAAAQRRTLAPL